MSNLQEIETSTPPAPGFVPGCLWNEVKQLESGTSAFNKHFFRAPRTDYQPRKVVVNKIT